MLQNRVDPYGNLIKTSARGAWMGNRGLLHNAHQQIVRQFRLKAWITCVLEFRGRKRKVMSPNLYTELFFLDEATAFAAGHRPCFECRRADYSRFKAYWLKGNPEYGFNEKTSIQLIDDVLHRERMDSKGSKVKHEEKLSTLSEGCVIELNDKPYLFADDAIYEWSPFGYGKSQALQETEYVTVLTPKSTVNAFRAGYVPQVSVFVRLETDKGGKTK